MISGTDYTELYLVTDVHFSTGADYGTRVFSHAPNLFSEFVSAANTRKPVAILHLGDACESPGDQSMYSNQWGSIHSSIPKYITPGNHDYDDMSTTQIEALFGYAAEPITAGSRFNKEYAINDNIRLVMLDSTFNGSDNHGNHSQSVRIHTDAVDWLQNILLTSLEKNILIATHCMPHLTQFDSVQASQIKSMIDDVTSTRPDLKVTWLSGHHHLLNVTKYVNLGLNQVGYIVPAMIENSDGRYAILRINSAGEISISGINVPYTGS